MAKTEEPAYAGGKAGRTISRDGLAIRYSLQCEIPMLRAAALQHVLHAIEAEHGSTTKIVARIGVSLSTYQSWIAAVPELAEAHYKHRPDGAPGRVPHALQKPKRKKKAKTKA